MSTLRMNPDSPPSETTQAASTRSRWGDWRLLWGTLGVGFCEAGAAYFLGEARFALAVLAGTLLIAHALWITIWLARRLLPAGQTVQLQARWLILVFPLKLIGNAFLLWLLLVWMGLDAMGVVLGLSSLFPALVVWVIVKSLR